MVAFHDLGLVFEKIIDCNFESAHANEELYIYGSKQFLNLKTSLKLRFIV